MLLMHSKKISTNVDIFKGYKSNIYIQQVNRNLLAQMIKEKSIYNI